MVKKKTSIKVLDFDEYLGSIASNPGRSRQEDELDVVLRDAAKMKVRRLKTMELDKYLIESEQELEKLKRGESLTSTGASLPSNADFLNMSKALADLSPEEAQRVRSSYTFFKMAEKSGGGSSGMNLLLPLIGYARQNPGSSENQMVSYLKLMDTQFSKGLEIAKAVNPGKKDNPMEFLKLMKDLVIEGVRNPLMQAIKEMQPSQGLFDQILTHPDLYNRAKEIGMFGGGSGATKGTIDLEIEKLRGERELSMKKLDLEWRKDSLEREANDKRTDTIISIFGPIAGALAGQTSERMKVFGQQQAAAHNPTVINPTPPREIPLPQNVVINCSCGYQGTEPLTNPPQPEIICPNCGLALKVNTPPETPTMEENTI